MKTATTFAIALSTLMLLGSCKKKESTDENDNTTTVVSDTVSADTTSADTAGSGQTAHKTTGMMHRQRKMTQDEIDSLKAERDKVVTPPSNSGASLTPGSGPATPKNTKTYGGKTTTMDGEK